MNTEQKEVGILVSCDNYLHNDQSHSQFLQKYFLQEITAFLIMYKKKKKNSLR